MIRVKNESGEIIAGVYKDRVGALIVDNKQEYNKYISERERIIKQKEMDERINKDITELKSEMAEIKDLLKSFISQKK